MNERAIAVRVSTVSLLVPGCAGLTYALVVPAFLGREEEARAALLQVTLAATACEGSGSVRRSATASAASESARSPTSAAPTRGAA